MVVATACSDDAPKQKDSLSDAGNADADIADTEVADADAGGCTDGEERACGTDEGACTAGTQTCAGGEWGACEGQVEPGEETCSGIDDNCDGLVDNIEPLGFEAFWLDESHILGLPPLLAADGDRVWAAWGQISTVSEPGEMKVARLNADGSFDLEPTVIPVSADDPQIVEALLPVDGGLLIAYSFGRVLHTVVVSEEGAVVEGPYEFVGSRNFSGRIELLPAAGGVLMARIYDGRMIGTRLGMDGVPLDTAAHWVSAGEGADLKLATLPDRYGVLSSTNADEAPKLHLHDHYGRELVDPISVSDQQESSKALGLFSVDAGFMAVWTAGSSLFSREFDKEGAPRTDVIEMPIDTYGARNLDVFWNGRGITAFGNDMTEVYAWTRDGELGMPQGVGGASGLELPRSPAVEGCEACRVEGITTARSNAGWLWAISIRQADGSNRYQLRGGPIACPVREDSCGEPATHCDGWDRDCDGLIEDRPAPDGECATGLPGVCGEGSYACTKTGPTCVPSTLGDVPQCDGLDNNCNGLVDDMPLVEELRIPFDGDAAYHPYITPVDGGWQLFWNQRTLGSSGGSLMTVQIDSNFTVQGTPVRLGAYAEQTPDTATDGQATWVVWDSSGRVYIQRLDGGQPRTEPPVEVGRGEFPRVVHRNGELTVTWDEYDSGYYAGFRVFDEALQAPSASVKVGDLDAKARGLTLAPYEDRWLGVWSSRANPDDGSSSGDKRYLLVAAVIGLDGTVEGTPIEIGANKTTTFSVDADIYHAAHANIVQRPGGGYWVVWGGQSSSDRPTVVALDASLQLEGSAPLVEFSHGGSYNYCERIDVEVVDGRLRTLNRDLYRHDADGGPTEKPMRFEQFGMTSGSSNFPQMASGPEGLVFFWSEKTSDDPEEWSLVVGSMIECSLQ
jgi:hypothetical protein